MKTRRTPALTTKCRDLFEEYLYSEGWVPGETIPRIAQEVGLEPSQVRDAIFAPSADHWRQMMIADHNSRRATCRT